MLHLENEVLRLDLSPDHGASVRQMEFRGACGWQPVLMPDTAGPEGALSSGLFWMLPFANRARNNLLHDIALRPNTAEKLALHGTAWQCGWRVEARDVASVSLSLRPGDADGPFAFSAGLELRLEGASFIAHIWLRNESAHSIPAGLGAHPYFPRLDDTQLQFESSHFYLEGPDHLPTDAISLPPELDFSSAGLLPRSWRNNAYGGWNGTARIRQPGLGYQVTMLAQEGMRELMFYTDPALPRFALEPQSHTSGATLNAVTAPQVGLTVLDPGQTLASGFTLTLTPLR
jgi:aldose 1-epimerase